MNVDSKGTLNVEGNTGLFSRFLGTSYTGTYLISPITTESTLSFWVGTNGLLLTITTGRGVFLNIGTYTFGIAATGI